ncbi:hypothetical protein CFAM422_010613 [Trichoderma lentiforme]|uniref:Uncharacterized protein n=1 Tax=Trichoderma lentiforme TaxID=1567552 RepID=A0A9P4X8E8_9HYPO|nr:hypothetical protein CFAM422_010613 [Trichoderma lentiforme]
MAGVVIASPSTATVFLIDPARPSTPQQSTGPLHDTLRTKYSDEHDGGSNSPSNAAVAGSVLQGSPTWPCACAPFPTRSCQGHGTLHGILPRRTYAHHTCFAADISRCTVYE